MKIIGILRIGFIFFAFVFLIFGHSLQAQNQPRVTPKKIVRGTVIDGTTSRAIAYVHIKANQQNIISGSEGNFSLMLSPGDSLIFSHVSYTTRIVKFLETSEKQQQLIILIPKVTVLKEVVISTMSETEFKRKVLETIPQLTVEEEVAQENIRILNQAAKFALPMQMSSYESYRDYLKGPQGVVIFSSNGSKGLVKAIKNIVSSSRYKFPSFINRTPVKTEAKVSE